MVIHSNYFILCSYYVLGSVPGSEIRAVNKTDKYPYLLGTYILLGDTNN